jgi:hypothetical protein
LLPVLDNGVPGMDLAGRFEFPRVGRVQVWVLAGATARVAMTTANITDTNRSGQEAP